MHLSMIKKKMLCENHALRARFCMKKNAPQESLIKQNVPQARFFDLVLMGSLSY